MEAKLQYKKLVINKAIARQEEIIEDFRNSMQEMKSSEMLVNEDQLDYGQGGFNSASSEMIDNLEKELDLVLNEMDQLQILKEQLSIKDRVALGTVVKTDRGNFFPSVSVEDFDVDGVAFYGISKEAPLFQHMKGKAKGESFKYKDKIYKILDVY